MDYASYAMLASACLLLFFRISMTLVKHDRVQQARRVHHAPRNSAWARLGEVASRPRVRLAIGFALLLGAFRAVPVLLAMVQPAAGDSRIADALAVAAKWGVLLIAVRSARTFLGPRLMARARAGLD